MMEQLGEVRMRRIWEIFLLFLKISPVTFGGGFAMIPILEKEVVEKKKWMDIREMTDIMAAAQVVPGAVGVNSAIFIGYQVAGVMGAFAAMFGIVLPTFGIVLILAALFDSLQSNPYVLSALKGIRPVIIALIGTAAVKMGKVSLVDKACWSVCILALILLNVFTNLNIFFVILAGAAAGVIIAKIREKLGIAVVAQQDNIGEEIIQNEADRGEVNR